MLLERHIPKIKTKKRKKNPTLSEILTSRERAFLTQRRTLILGGMQLIFSSFLFGRLFNLQVLNRHYYQKIADKNRFFFLSIQPTRGYFLDRQGQVLAGSQTRYNIFLNLSSLHDWDTVVQHLSSIIHIDREYLERIFQNRFHKKKNTPILIREGASWEEFTKLELSRNELEGVFSERIESRFYSYPFLMSHVLGHIGAPSSEEAAKDPVLSEVPELKIGKNGLEKIYEKELRGSIGWKQIEVDAKRNHIRSIQSSASFPGNNVRLALDLGLQQKIYEQFEQTKVDDIPLNGACIVMDPQTGAILAFVSYPGYDSNIFLSSVKPSTWKTLIDNPSTPLLNKCTQGLYAPGSAFKMIIALAALKAGVIQERTTFHCPGHFDVGTHRFHCWSWKHGGHGHVQLKTALARSCDIYFYHVAAMIGAQHIIQMAKTFGFGALSGVDIPSEKKGLLPSKEWKRLIKKQSWTLGDTINLSIGQGYMLATPMQLTCMMAMLVNGGKPVTPYFCSLSQSSERNPPIDIPQEHIDLILGGLDMAVNEPGGTAYASRIEDPQWRMGGKTGSSQVSRITQKQRDLNQVNDRLFHLKEHAIFVGYAPLHKPKFVTTVILEHGGGGGRVAAPFGRSVLINARKLIV